MKPKIKKSKARRIQAWAVVSVKGKILEMQMSRRAAQKALLGWVCYGDVKFPKVKKVTINL